MSIYLFIYFMISQTFLYIYIFLIFLLDPAVRLVTHWLNQ